MASPTHIYMTRIRLKVHKMGRKRKNRLAKHGTTPSWQVFFGDNPSDASGTALPGTALPGTALPGTALPGTALKEP